MMKLYNTLTRKVEDFTPHKDKTVRMYSCGPTVYDHIHIGNLSAFIYADTLRRALKANNYQIKHVMNFTDVDDKTIRRSQERYPEDAPEIALKKLTDEYKQIFLVDMYEIGNDVNALEFISATDSIDLMQKLIKELYNKSFAYIADDGVYFSIEKYRASGKKYGQLLELNQDNTSAARINNDEYDKDSVHDFALWKLQKNNEPAWEFELNGHNLLGRPGWHIECSAMSTHALGQPFDIHTGGVDLIFPHHENEIAQSTAGSEEDYAEFFVHNEHLLVDGRKMSKSLNNFYTLEDIKEKGFDPLAFRLMVLQSHYRSQSNFTWENLEAAQNRLKNWQAFSDLQFQDNYDGIKGGGDFFYDKMLKIKTTLADDLNTPEALRIISETIDETETRGVDSRDDDFQILIKFLDDVFGLRLSERKDINKEQKLLLEKRDLARLDKKWSTSDKIRDGLADQGIGVKDTPSGQIWYRI
jgi:cysteinyl-tRNA synthetase